MTGRLWPVFRRVAEQQPLVVAQDHRIVRMGLTRLKDFPWEELALPIATRRDQKDLPKDPAIVKRELKRQQTLAARKGMPIPSSLPQPRTLLGLARGVSSWSDCPVPLTAVINREIDKQGEVHDWVLVTTAAHWSAAHTRATYRLRPAIEERHRQYKCFWDVTRLTSRKFSLIITQVLFTLLAYTLLQAHLHLKRRDEMNRRTRARLLQTLGPTVEVVALYYQQRFCLLLLPEFAEILLTIEGEARQKLLKKMRQIKRDVYLLLENARSP